MKTCCFSRITAYLTPLRSLVCLYLCSFQANYFLCFVLINLSLMLPANSKLLSCREASTQDHKGHWIYHEHLQSYFITLATLHHSSAIFHFPFFIWNINRKLPFNQPLPPLLRNAFQITCEWLKKSYRTLDSFTNHQNHLHLSINYSTVRETASLHLCSLYDMSQVLRGEQQRGS